MAQDPLAIEALLLQLPAVLVTAIEDGGREFLLTIPKADEKSCMYGAERTGDALIMRRVPPTIGIYATPDGLRAGQAVDLSAAKPYALDAGETVRIQLSEIRRADVLARGLAKQRRHPSPPGK